MRNRLTNTCIGQVFAVTFCAKIRTKTTNKNWLAEAGVIFKDEILKYLYIILLVCISKLAVADSCISDLNSLEVFKIIHSGTAISYPFSSSRLVEGKDEPELETKILVEFDQFIIIKRSNLLYNRSINSDSNKSINTRNDTANILFRGLNSGWLVTWGFIRINNCWHLNTLKDQST